MAVTLANSAHTSVTVVVPKATVNGDGFATATVTIPSTARGNFGVLVVFYLTSGGADDTQANAPNGAVGGAGMLSGTFKVSAVGGENGVDNWLANIPGGATTATYTFANSSTAATMSVTCDLLWLEFAGMSLGSVQDQFASASTTSAVTSLAVGPTGTLALADELAVAAFGIDPKVTETFTTPSGWTAGTSDSATKAQQGYAVWKETASTAALSVTGSWSSSSAIVGVVALLITFQVAVPAKRSAGAMRQPGGRRSRTRAGARAPLGDSTASLTSAGAGTTPQREPASVWYATARQGRWAGRRPDESRTAFQDVVIGLAAERAWGGRVRQSLTRWVEGWAPGLFSPPNPLRNPAGWMVQALRGGRPPRRRGGPWAQPTDAASPDVSQPASPPQAQPAAVWYATARQRRWAGRRPDESRTAYQDLVVSAAQERGWGGRLRRQNFWQEFLSGFGTPIKNPAGWMVQALRGGRPPRRRGGPWAQPADAASSGLSFPPGAPQTQPAPVWYSPTPGRRWAGRRPDESRTAYQDLVVSAAQERGWGGRTRRGPTETLLAWVAVRAPVVAALTGAVLRSIRPRLPWSRLSRGHRRMRW